ncbi:hypothetical protein GIB67_029742 [Kingdonia uniflora]|uniref:Uncharacterized protein n=1 Tax=Kingdonia uniflora TaxID=39325 RepID=A0A7J7LLT3_9MAGN|nr:hypothetical protein GIB67_029742 [Kingdonia uniflora]
MDSTRAALLFDNATNGSFLQCWNDYAVKLSRVLCSFLLAVEDLEFHSGQSSNVQSAVQVSSVYCELSIKWVMKVLVTVFPFIKACSNPNELPSHLRSVFEL